VRLDSGFPPAGSWPPPSGRSSVDLIERRRTLPLVPPAPIAVVAFALLVTVVFAVLGLRQIYHQAETSTAEKAELLAATVAARLLGLGEASRHDLVERAARRGASAIWVLDAKGKIVEEASGTQWPLDLPSPHSLKEGAGSLLTTKTTLRFVVRPVEYEGPTGKAPAADLERLSVVVATEVPESPEGIRDFLVALATLATLLTGVAAAVAFAVARDVRVDVEDLNLRIREIAGRGRDTTDRAQDTVPVQALDEVGELATAFNGLVERFATAEKTYADALARIEEIDRERANFLATVSHELRSPLNAILGFADVLLGEVDGPLEGESREEVAIIKQSGLHLLGLINDILELSAIASGQLQLQRSRVDLRKIAEDVVREAVGQLGSKQVELRVESASPTCEADADPRRVRQILQNLVGNAVKFTPSGEVIVSITSDAHYATLRVRDTGPGVPPREREAIFAEYRQAGDVRSRRRGTGLGLPIARRLAMMHGGTVRLESEPRERGSTFVLRLPVRARGGLAG